MYVMRLASGWVSILRRSRDIFVERLGVDKMWDGTTARIRLSLPSPIRLCNARRLSVSNFRLYVKKLYLTDLRENFTTGVYVDKKELIKF